ncbi:MAG: glycosyltransferase family 2 protein [Candidatus Rokubacteria bacterium]|nr:glycosyltransferase family 2 protein [Candidatus Rokubacteria bacterium]
MTPRVGTQNIELSVVLPVLDEAPSLPLLHRELTEVLEGLGRPYELIFVDDGSRDESFQVLEKLHRRDDRVRVLQLRRNFGKAAALSVGFAHARGQVIATLDADLQDDPAELPRLVAALEEGYDLVSGWKVRRQDPPSKTWPSRVFNAVTGRLTGLRLHDFNSGFKVYRRAVVEELRLYGELHRFIPALAARRGFIVGEVPVNHRPRRFGRSKYGAVRFVRGCLDLLTVLFLTRYTRRPLHLFGGLGLLSLAIGLLVNLYLTALWLAGVRPIGNRPLLAFGVLSILVGIQSFSLGLLSELVLSFQARGNEDVSIRSRLG